MFDVVCFLGKREIEEMFRRLFLLVFFGLLFFGFGDCAVFGNPLKKLFKPEVEADPNKVYTLSENNGPWLILLCTFRGEHAESKANMLVYELRKNYKFKAYVFAGEFNLDFKKDMKTDKNLRKYSSLDTAAPQRINYIKNGKFVEYVVLVGDYQSPDELQKDLEKIRNTYPACMFEMTGKEVPRVITDQVPRPFPMPFAVPNPSLPAGYIAQTGNNYKFIARLNEKHQFSLLDCPRKYTVQIATFTGKSSFKQEANLQFENQRNQNTKLSQLQLGEVAADKLCKILRAQGIEAYQFHDQFSSIVTVGGFDYYEIPTRDSNINLRPEIVQIMNYFRGQPNNIFANQPMSYEPRRFNGIECDLQPKVIEVPAKFNTGK
jgi:hypothetical protein